MRALPANDRRRNSSIGTEYVATVGSGACRVRGTTVWPIEEVLGVAVEAVLLAAIEAGGHDGPAVIDGHDPDTGALVADLLESRMIVPLRPRRRRERAVSSRAHFYAGNEG